MRDLFPEFSRQSSAHQRREYISRCMVELIERGEFWLSEVMNQELSAMTVAGEVIFGRGISDGSDGYEAGTPINGGIHVPQEIAAHKVTISAKDGKRPIRYADGSRPMVGVVAGQRRQFRVPQLEKNWVELKTSKADLGLREAWLLLKQAGEYVAFGGTKEDQDVNWLYSEANPMDKGRKSAAA